ncbi:MAG TPA: hypothetical protein VHD61_08255, partial [Lacunisphaera sp.]|nr:hypothetical protein [Lacunisphaera sp.]
MHTSYPRKALDLAAALLRAPFDIPPYLRTLPCWGRQPTDYELPWLTFAAIRRIERHLDRDSRVFEFGSGGSTFFFARHAGQVTCVESHPEWHATVTELARQRHYNNLTCLLEPMGNGVGADYADHSFFRPILQEHWDLILVDSFCAFETGGLGGALRPHAFSLAVRQLKPGGMIVLDDSWLYPELLRPRVGWQIEDCVGVGPCRYGVSSTAVFRWHPG